MKNVMSLGTLNTQCLLLGFPAEVLSWPRNEQQTHTHTPGFWGFSQMWCVRYKGEETKQVWLSQALSMGWLGGKSAGCHITGASMRKSGRAAHRTGVKKINFWGPWPSGHYLLAGRDMSTTKVQPSPGSNWGEGAVRRKVWQCDRLLLIQ